MGVWRAKSAGEPKTVLVRRTAHLSCFRAKAVFLSLESAPGRGRWDASGLLRVGSTSEADPRRPAIHSPPALCSRVHSHSGGGLLFCHEEEVCACRSYRAASSLAVSFPRLRI